MSKLCGSAIFPANEKFARSLYEKCALNLNRSFATIPFPIYACAALLYIGASGTTAIELETSLPLPSQNREEIGKMFNEIFVYYKKKTQVKLAIDIFHSNEADLNQDFVNYAKKYFLITPQIVRFTSNATAAKMINDSVFNATDRKITNILQKEDLEPNMRMVIISVFLFTGMWKKPFMRYDTIKENFRVSESNQSPVDMMTQTDIFQCGYCKELDSDMIILPYDDGEFSLVFILPKAPILKNLEITLRKFAICEVIETLPQNMALIKIPKFKIESSIELGRQLAELGVGKIFSTDAEFNRIVRGNTELNKFYAKTIFQVTEDGTEVYDAAHAPRKQSRVSITKTENPFMFVANHPFIFVLKSNKGIFLMGKFQG